MFHDEDYFGVAPNARKSSYENNSTALLIIDIKAFFVMANLSPIKLKKEISKSQKYSRDETVLSYTFSCHTYGFQDNWHYFSHCKVLDEREDTFEWSIPQASVTDYIGKSEMV